MRSKAALAQHVRDEHHKVLCDVCLNHKTCYSNELELYSDSEKKGRHSSEMKQHLKTHPYCQFCRKHMLDSDALFLHLQRDHESCFLCERAGIMYEYFRNYDNLERHYRNEHFMCEDPACRGVVFNNALDLASHQQQVHYERSRSLRMEFRDVYNHMQQHRDGHANERRNVHRRNFAADLVVYSDGGSHGNNAGGGGDRRNHSASETETLPVQTNQGSAPTGNVSASQGQQADLSIVMPAAPTSREEEAERNQVLVARLRSCLDVADFELFKDLSGQYRDGELDAEEYFGEATRLLGSDARSILPELTALLNNPERKRELSRVVRGAYRMLEAPSPDQATPVERDTHHRSDSEESFPALPGSRPNLIPTAAPESEAKEDFPALGPSSGATATVSQRGASSRTRQQRAGRRPPPPTSDPEQDFPAMPSQTSTSASADRSRGRDAAEAPADGIWSERNPADRQLPERPMDVLTHVRPGTSVERSTPKNQELFPPLNNSGGPNADPAMRAGAVWGGTARRVHQGKRSQKNSSSRERRNLSSEDDFPAMGDLRISDSGSASGTRTTVPASGFSGYGVTDLGALERNRRREIAQSAVPGIGRNGYSWERQKAQKAKQKAKEELAEREKRRQQELMRRSEGTG
eukprot:CAMPEP_0198733436 /NCGR_PEP_ID=MMETSP1475-20131203/45825_1 /TAXON_ID= ORGANISM="Unidentified sp., Strain CCMP1999" /NCGR_SAMPLE_ID=MMETSP1475 /ASSEMBLY_ACC=CAM_ASM_001111 /LENGTH=636 /DNA_ID=CAMNT_0044496739 /DNA_START=99 /DNA_END=2012 /DNA_ORIENTATION=-